MTDPTPEAEAHVAEPVVAGADGGMPPAPSTPSQPANPVFVNRPITGQEWCEYLFQDGFIYRIVAPKALYTRKDDDRSVRVVDMEGVSHYVPGDYRIARWKTKPGFPEVAF